MSKCPRKIAIIDYKSSNLFSVQNACDYGGLDATITSDKKCIKAADAAILPGVGAFADAMKKLKKLDLIEPIKAFIHSGKPFMGVCLGLQLLFTESEEFGLCKGLNMIQGQVRKFPLQSEDGKKIKVPQIGWNKITKTNDSDGSPLKNVVDGAFMYFVHSYYVEPADNTCILTKTNYEGIEYCSSVLYENIFATQFHPEKSAQNGVEIYQAWAETFVS